jgi:MoaA/NifB/PqqE/SkfB family radical SAM enzyme
VPQAAAQRNRGLRRSLVEATPTSLRERLGPSMRARRLAHRLGFPLAEGIPQPPLRPVGAKLELTYRCNLKCPFCYTDSPRRTRERAADLANDEWRRVVDEVLALGTLEAVVTGGEPFLRRELALEVVERLDEGGVAITLNTNGWFVDDEIAGRLARCGDLQVNVSLDGATPELHDGVRGVPGSWARGVAAIDRLLQRGVPVRVIHVVTPANVDRLPQLLDHLWLLGVTSVRVTPVAPLGAAARETDWRVDGKVLRQIAGRFVANHGGVPRVDVVPLTFAGLADLEDVAPCALLVRPNGTVMIDSIRPFRFGRFPEDTLAACWDRIAGTWPQPEILRWADSISGPNGMRHASVVAYRDEEIPLAGTSNGAHGSVADPARVPTAIPAVEAGDLAAARARIVALALARRYRLADVRWSDDGTGRRWVRIRSERQACILNPTATRVMDACADGAPAVAVAALAARFPSQPRERLEDDALDAVRLLLDRRIVAPAPA